MSSNGLNTSINLGLPAFPQTDNPALYEELSKIYNALRSVTLGVDDYTAGGELELRSELVAAQAVAELVKLRRVVKELTETLLFLLPTVNWAQPGAIGGTTPNTATFTTLSVNGNASLGSTNTGTFGANGKSASAAVALPTAATDAATTQALANALRLALINFGLGT